MLIGKYNTLENRRAWQWFLQSRGHAVTVDGIWGPKTMVATKNFQTIVGLENDGIVGEKTLAAAKAAGFAGFGPESSTAAGASTEVENRAAGVSPDPKNIAKLDAVHPTLKRKVTELIGLAAAEGCTLRVAQGLRTFAEQDQLFNQWRDGKDNDGDGRIDEADERVTRAAGGQSNHNYGLAADLAFVVLVKQKDGSFKPTVSWEDSLYRKIGPWASRVGLVWGGNWKSPDLPHVELPGIPNWRTLLAWYKAGGLQNVWGRF